MTLDLKVAVQFTAVAEELSFTRAAKRIGVPQPLLSARIRKLEQQLGCLLFDRTSRRCALTADGETFLRLVKPLAIAAANASIAVEEWRGGRDLRLRIGAPPYSAGIPQRIALVERMVTDRSFSVEMELGWTPALLDRLRSDELDACFAIEPFAMTGLEALHICDLGLKLVRREDDPIGPRNKITCTELAGRTVATFARGLNPDLYDRLYSEMAREGVKLLDFPEMRPTLFETKQGALPIIVSQLSSGDDNLLGFGPSLLESWYEFSEPISLLLARKKSINSLICDRFWDRATQTFPKAKLG